MIIGRLQDARFKSNNRLCSCVLSMNKPYLKEWSFVILLSLFPILKMQLFSIFQRWGFHPLRPSRVPVHGQGQRHRESTNSSRSVTNASVLSKASNSKRLPSSPVPPGYLGSSPSFSHLHSFDLIHCMGSREFIGL